MTWNGGTDSWQSCAAIQRPWQSGEVGWQESQGVQLRRTAESCTWGGTVPSTRTCWEPPCWKAALQKRTWGPGGHRVEHEPAACPCCLAGWWYSWLHWGKHHQQSKKGDPSALLSAGEAVAGALSPVLGFPVQERHEYFGKSPTEGHKDGKETGALLLWGEAETAGTILENRSLSEDVTDAYKYPREGTKRTEPGFFHWCPVIE